MPTATAVTLTQIHSSGSIQTQNMINAAGLTPNWKPVTVHIRKDSGQFSDGNVAESATGTLTEMKVRGEVDGRGATSNAVDGDGEKVGAVDDSVHAVTAEAQGGVQDSPEAHKLIIGVDFGTTYSGFVLRKWLM